MKSHWAGLFLMAVVVTSQQASAEIAKIHRTVLTNGMNVMVVPDHRIPFGAMSITYANGYSQDPQDKSGLSALTWEMANSSTLHLGSGEASTLLANAGALGRDSGCGVDKSWETVMVPSNRLALPMWLWSDRMGFFVQSISQSSLDKQKELLQARYESNVKGVPCGLCERFIEAELFPVGHPYHESRWASTETIGNIGLADIAARHPKLFNPAQAVLTVVGDVRQDDVVQLARQYFEPIPSAQAISPAPVAAHQLKGETRIYAAADIPRPRVMIAWATPAHYQEGDVALDLVSRVLVGKATSLLFWNLDLKNLATETTARQVSRLAESFFIISTSVANNVSAEQVIDATDRTVSELLNNFIRGSVFQTAVSDSLLRFCRKDQSLQGRAGVLSSWFVATGQEPSAVPRIGAFAALTSFQVTQTAQRYLGPDRVVLVVQPDPRAPRAGELRSVVRGKQ